jgi:hypothetical protein
VCPNNCSWGIEEKQDSVTPQQVGMTDDDIAQAKLGKNGQLFRCSHCGRVWEKYRDQMGEWVKRKIGTYDGPGPELGYTPFRGRQDWL